MYADGYSPTAYDNFVLYEQLFINDKRPCVTLIDGTQIYDIDCAYYFHFYNWAIKPTWVDSKTTPYMIFGSKGYIPQLENKQYNADIVEHLNLHGLDIYLYETLTFTKQLEDRPDFKLKKTSNLLDTIISAYGKSMLFECHQDDYDSLLCYELESISQFAKNNNLTNVKVNTCHYNIDIIKNKYPTIKLQCKDLHLASMVHHPVENLYPFQLVEPTDLIETKFISPNWRYHSARHILMTYLVDKPGIYSWYYKGTADKLKNNLWFDLSESRLKSIVEYGLPLLNQVVPLEINCTQAVNTIDGQVDYLKYPNGIQGSPSDYRMDDAYLKSFCAVVTESYFAMPTGIISEKVLNAIKLGRPFVLVAPPNTLEYMQKLGFQTFGRYWDEAYDSEQNHEQRLLKIIEVLDYINSMSIDTLKVWYANMKDILEHNAEVVKHLTEAGNVL
jgi:hypothetical protein